MLLVYETSTPYQILYFLYQNVYKVYEKHFIYSIFLSSSIEMQKSQMTQDLIIYIIRGSLQFSR